MPRLKETESGCCLPAAAECDSLPDGRTPDPSLLFSARRVPPSLEQPAPAECDRLLAAAALIAAAPPALPASASACCLTECSAGLCTTCGAGRRRTWTARLCLRGLLCSVLQSSSLFSQGRKLAQRTSHSRAAPSSRPADATPIDLFERSERWLD